jgi:hypothetical protein
MYDQQPGSYPPPPGQQQAGAIAVTLTYHPLGFLLAMFKPQTELNGHPVANAWGRQVIPVQPGQYHVHVHIPYFLPPRMGPADLPVTVYPGQTVELEYRAPLGNFFKGALGAPPQKYPGMILQIILLSIVGVVVLCVCGGLIVSAMDSGNSSSLPAFEQIPVVQQLMALLRL